VHPEHGALRDLLLDLQSRGDSAARRYTPEQSRLREKVARQFRIIEERELEDGLQLSEVDLLSHTGRYVFLPGVMAGKWMMPVLAVSYRFDSLSSSARFRLGLFLEGLESEPVAIGFRIETDEGLGEGMHDYCHLQFITQFDKADDASELPGPNWLPVKQPAIPLDAYGPLSALACLVTGLYGRPYLAQMLSTARGRYAMRFMDHMHVVGSLMPVVAQVTAS
jgi:hypothetical protein